MTKNIEIIIHELEVDKWELVANKDMRAVIFNPSGRQIMIAKASGETVDDIDLSTLSTIGGFTSEYYGNDGDILFARCLKPGGFLRIREYGIVDPETNQIALAQSINQLRADHINHVTNLENPHKVTKEQVGLGNLPNEVSTMEDPSSEALIQKETFDVLQIQADDHEANQENPHKVTKEQVGLGNVDNYSTSTIGSVLDTSIDNEFVTPRSAAVLIKQITQVAYSVPPQCIIAGDRDYRSPGWSAIDCDSPTKLVSAVSGRTIKVNKGLQVSFAHDNKSRLSEVLTEDLEYTVPKSPRELFYIYVDVADNGVIESVGSTYVRPQTGSYRQTKVSDYFNTSTCSMQDIDGEEIIRVYIAKVYFSENEVDNIVSVPFGQDYTYGPDILIEQNQNIILPNPFIEPVEVSVEVKYNDSWGATEWNDQIGVKGHPYPNNPEDLIIIQSGLMGLLANGQESGSPFGLSYLTVSEPMFFRVNIRKKFR